MKIAIDARPLASPRTGVGNYILALITNLISSNQSHQYHLYGISNILEDPFAPINPSTLADNIDRKAFYAAFPFNNTINRFVKVYRRLVLRSLDIDIFFGTGFKGIFGRSFKTIITIHDMAHKHYPDYIEPKILRYLQGGLFNDAQMADLIITVSESTKRDVIKFFNINENKIRVIYHGIDGRFRPIYNKDMLINIQRKYNLSNKFLLYVGTIQPRKNILGLIKAYRVLLEDSKINHDLVIVGEHGWGYKEIHQLIKYLELEKRVIFTGYISNNDLTCFYNLADVFVFPSYYEGFGFPVLEAMACGTPVVTSSASSLLEVAGDAAILVDPNSVEDIAGGIRRLLSDDKCRNICIEKGLKRVGKFNWRTTAIKTLEAFDDVAGK